MQPLLPEVVATILVVDDVEVNRSLLTRRLKKDGHEVVEACNGVEALELVCAQNFDLVLLDIMMPILDGYQVLETLKKDKALCHVPVVMITALSDIESIARCIEMGAEGFLFKPFNTALLKARVSSSLQKKQMHDLQQRYRERIEEHNALLELNARRQDEENHLVAHLMAQMMHSPGLRDEHVRYWISASELVSGDLAAAARNPQGQFFVMLADSTGHGLPAALNLLPINWIFYRMVEKGFPVSTIVEEMNRAIKRQSPPDRFVAAIIACIDTGHRTIELWNGGIPAAVFCDEAGVVKHAFRSLSFPFGIVGDGFPSHTETYQWDGDGQLIMFSDGLLEAENDQGLPFGFERLATALGDVTDEERFDNLVKQLHGHLGEKRAHDDVSLLMTRCISTEEQP